MYVPTLKLTNDSLRGHGAHDDHVPQEATGQPRPKARLRPQCDHGTTAGRHFGDGSTATTDHRQTHTHGPRATTGRAWSTGRPQEYDGMTPGRPWSSGRPQVEAHETTVHLQTTTGRQLDEHVSRDDHGATTGLARSTGRPRCSDGTTSKHRTSPGATMEHWMTEMNT